MPCYDFEHWYWRFIAFGVVHREKVLAATCRIVFGTPPPWLAPTPVWPACHLAWRAINYRFRLCCHCWRRNRSIRVRQFVAAATNTISWDPLSVKWDPLSVKDRSRTSARAGASKGRAGELPSTEEPANLFVGHSRSNPLTALARIRPNVIHPIPYFIEFFASGSSLRNPTF